MQIKTTMRYHLTMAIMAIIKKFKNNKCQRGCREKGILFHCLWDCKFVQPLWKSEWWFLRKLKIEISYDLAKIEQVKLKIKSPYDPAINQNGGSSEN